MLKKVFNVVLRKSRIGHQRQAFFFHLSWGTDTDKILIKNGETLQ